MNQLVKSYPVLGSSVNPEQLSLMIKGALGFLAVILVGLGVNQIEINGLIDQIVSLVLLISQAATLAVAVYGGIRKIINQFKK